MDTMTTTEGVASDESRQTEHAEAEDSTLVDETSLLCKRRKLYPGLYANNEQVSNAIEEFAVISSYDKGRPRLESEYNLAESCIEIDLEEGGNTNNGSENSYEQPHHATQRGAGADSYTNADIWGVMPAKEPNFLVSCHICNRQVNTLRFAPHLDKCMGLGWGRAAATNQRWKDV
jgi:hypothetical protein